MQVYAVKMFNFFRFSENNNSIVFDISPEDKTLIETGKLTLDELYNRFKANPVAYIEATKKRGVVNLIGISGIIGDNSEKSNGAGKSSILEAICYAHYDQVVRRNVNTDKTEKAGQSVVTRFNGLIPDNVKICYVEEFFEEKGNIYRIKRGRKFSESKITNTPILEFECISETGKESHSGHRTGDTNESIANVLNMDYEVFCNSVMFGQSDSGKFLTSTDKTRKEMLIGLLRLDDVITGCLEEVRERISARKDTVTLIKTQKELIEEGLSSKKPIEELQLDIELETKKIADTEQQIQKISLKLEDLQKSEVLTAAGQLKEERNKVKADLSAKEAEKETQINEWKTLYFTTKKSADSNSEKVTAIDDGIKDITSQIEKKNGEVKSFNLDEHNKALKKAAKAKEIKSDYENKQNQIQLEKESLISKITLVKSDIYRADAEIKSLKDQLKASGDKDEFQCDKCKSIVSRKHLEQEISKNEEIVKAKSTERQTLEKSQEDVDKKLADGKSKLSIIVDLIAQEPKIKSLIEGNERNKARIKELEASREEKENNKKSLLTHIEELRKQEKEYFDKCSAIKSKYEAVMEELKKSIVGIEKKCEGIEVEVLKITAQINELKQTKITMASSINNSSSKIGSIKKEIENIKIDKEKLVKIAVKLQNEEEGLNRLFFLENIFGLEGIQTRIVKKYLPILNAYMREFLDVLSNGEMTVKVYINDKSKVDIDIIGGSADTFNMLSGGEKMLVRLSVSIGLSMLSFTRCAQRPEMICLDEVLGCLDEFHVNSVFKLLAKLQDKFNRILVISHSSNVNKLIPHQILIEKQIGSCGYSSVKSIV